MVPLDIKFEQVKSPHVIDFVPNDTGSLVVNASHASELHVSETPAMVPLAVTVVDESALHASGFVPHDNEPRFKDSHLSAPHSVGPSTCVCRIRIKSGSITLAAASMLINRCVIFVVNAILGARHLKKILYKWASSFTILLKLAIQA